MPKVLPARYKFEKNEDGSYRALEGHTSKITGTAIASIIEKNPWQTPFSVACAMLGLYKEDISDAPAVHTGVVLEPIILDYVKNLGVIPADQLYGERRGPHNGWKQDFEDPIFGGHVDGVTEDGNVVEVKTTGSPEDWLTGVPEHYWLQASLYAYFMGASEIMFVVGVVDDEARSNPYLWKPEGNVSVHKVGLHPDLEEYLDYCRKWYADYVEKGLTPVPDMTNPIDKKVVAYLDAQLMGEKAIQDMVDEFAYHKAIIDSVKDSVKEHEKKAEDLKNLLKIYMDYNKVEKVHGTDVSYKISTSKRTIVDTEALKRDGIYSKYTKESETQTFRKTK